MGSRPCEDRTPPYHISSLLCFHLHDVVVLLAGAPATLPDETSYGVCGGTAGEPGNLKEVSYSLKLVNLQKLIFGGMYQLENASFQVL